MILGVGVDVVEIRRVAHLHARFGRRFAERILAPGEWQQYLASPAPARLLAKRFAVKEAAAKALGTGVGGQVSFADIATEHARGGAPRLVLDGGARRLAERLGVVRQHVSLADERETTVAVVILEGDR